MRLKLHSNEDSSIYELDKIVTDGFIAVSRDIKKLQEQKIMQKDQPCQKD
jgi:hypothetical protein